MHVKIRVCFFFFFWKKQITHIGYQTSWFYQKNERTFYQSESGAEWAKLWVKSIKTLFEFVEKLFNFDEEAGLADLNHLDFKSLI